jgi:hypothetical protein
VNSVEDHSKAYSPRHSSRKKPHRKVSWLHLAVGISGILLIGVKLVCQQFFHESSPIAELAFHLAGDVGIAFIVAVAVAGVFDYAYHEQTIVRPLADVEAHVERVKIQIETLNEHLNDQMNRVKESLLTLVKDVDVRDRDLDRQLQQLLRDAHMLQDARREGIVALHRRGESFRDAVREAVRSSDTFFWTMGRTHKEMLVQNGEDKGWIISELENKLSNAQGIYEVKILLANAFDKPQTFGTTAPPGNNAARDMLRNDVNGKQTTRGVLSMLDPYRLKENMHLKLLRKYPVPHGVIVTDKRIFVEHYLPSRAGGAQFILEVEKKELESDLYYTYKRDFESSYSNAEGAASVLERYVERKQKELNGRRLEDQNEEMGYLKKDEEALCIARKWEEA